MKPNMALNADGSDFLSIPRDFDRGLNSIQANNKDLHNAGATSVTCCIFMYQ